MRVKRNFQLIYESEEDPWKIGDAHSDRYDFYYDKIISLANARNSILDIGCGFGAFLARFKNDFNELSGIEVSREATAKGKVKYPFINHFEGSADNLKATAADAIFYDAIIYSDVIYYLNERDKHASLKWISEHLNSDGLAFVAGWCPGKRYLEYDELRRLVDKYFVLDEEHRLDSDHAIFLARKRRFFIAVTVDYETWSPIPAGKSINWDNDIFIPAENLLKLFKRQGICLTLMADMGEYFWLKENQPFIADKMEKQWAQAIEEGNDVQMHLHPNWLPETGARFEDGQWYWDPAKTKANQYDGDLAALIAKCKEALESVIRKTAPDYRVTSFRAGAYQAQPFKRLYEALTANGIYCDSSVYAGGISAERGYDYSLAYSNHQPYFANPYDPQLKAPPDEQAMVEIPLFTFKPGERWFLDSTEGKLFAGHLIDYLKEKSSNFISSECYRFQKWLKDKLGFLYQSLISFHKLINPLIPKSLAHFMTCRQTETLSKHSYFVMIGHTKSDLYFSDIEANLKKLKADGRFEFVTLSAMAINAMQELAKEIHKNIKTTMSERRNEELSLYLQTMIPWDTDTLLDLGRGSGRGSDDISKLYPWMKITETDLEKDFIDLSFSERHFDCVYADYVIQRAFNVDKVLNEIYRVLRPGGIIVASLPSDARNSGEICANYAWKTAPHEVRLRLENAGFFNIEIKEIDAFGVLASSPCPPSNDKMIYLKARKYSGTHSPLQRAVEAMNWLYKKLSPEKSSTGIDAISIISDGYAFCMGYAIALGYLLKNEGFDIVWITMIAQDHPRGRGPEKEDSHEVIQLTLPEGAKVILDPMSNHFFEHSIEELIMNPVLANTERKKDSRYMEKNYDLYSTSQWYEKAVKYCVRLRLEDKHKYIKIQRNT